MNFLSQELSPNSTSHEKGLEHHILLEIVRQGDSNDTSALLADLSHKPVTWELLVNMAYRNSVLSLFYSKLSQLPKGLVPESLLSDLRVKVQGQMFNNLMHVDFLARIVTELQQAGILAIPYKGPILAHEVYGNLALRSFGDLDLWVAPENYKRAQDWFKSKGFQCCAELEWESTFVDPKTFINIDLHKWVVSKNISDKFSFNLSFDHVKGRLVPLELSGNSLQQLSPEDLLLVLCAGWCKGCIPVLQDSF